MGYQPWAVGTGRETTDGNTIGFVDNEWISDSHAILIKQRNKMKKKETKQVIKILVEYLTDGQIKTLLQTLVKRTATVEEKKDKVERNLINQIKSIQSENLHGHYSKIKKQEILQLWFKDIIIGPYMITRSLSTYDVTRYEEIEGPLVGFIKNKMDTDLFSMKLDHITILDDRYYLISGTDAKAMDWPHDVKYDFIGVSGERQKTEEKRIKIIKKFIPHFIEGYDECEGTKYWVALEKNICGRYLRLYYGENVFGEMDY